jgi:hypothetical protein
VRLVVGIGLRVLVLPRNLFLLVFLFCIPTLVLCLRVLVFGCLVGFWLCVEQFLFYSFLSIFHSLELFPFGFVRVWVYLGYVGIRIISVCFCMLFYVCGKHEHLYSRLGFIES